MTKQAGWEKELISILNLLLAYVLSDPGNLARTDEFKLEIKDFFSQKLKREREKIVEEIEKLKDERKDAYWDRALDQAIAKLKSMEGK